MNAIEATKPSSDEEEESTHKKPWAGFVVVFLVWAAYWVGMACIEKKIDSTFTKFDPLSTLASGLAFWGVIYAIFLQKDELALQRTELRLTRNEVKGQKEQLEAQNITLKRQRFENTFFSLLNLHTNLVASMDVTGQHLTQPMDITYKGRDCFTFFYEEMRRHYQSRIVPITPGRPLEEVCLITYREFSDIRQTDVGHYFRTLYNIVKFIDGSDIDDKQIYINILRAQLSSSELSLLFYNCLGPYGKKFKLFVEKYGLLENMVLASLLDKRHEGLFEKSAFKSQS